MNHSSIHIELHGRYQYCLQEWWMKVQGHILDGGFELLILGGTYICYQSFLACRLWPICWIAFLFWWPQFGHSKGQQWQKPTQGISILLWTCYEFFKVSSDERKHLVEVLGLRKLVNLILILHILQDSANNIWWRIWWCLRHAMVHNQIEVALGCRWLIHITEFQLNSDFRQHFMEQSIWWLSRNQTLTNHGIISAVVEPRFVCSQPR